MKKHLGILAGALLAGLSGAAQASLIDRGGGMIYDVDRNITWLADANYAQTSGYQSTNMTWSQAVTWANNLVYGGYSDWRLPTTVPATSTAAGYNQTGSEMGHLFYTELGGVATKSLLTTHNANFSLFSNFQTNAYWSGTKPVYTTSNGDELAWQFHPLVGYQMANVTWTGGRALAVRDGDVAGAPSAVPLPGAVWLFASSLLGLTGISRRKRASLAV